MSGDVTFRAATVDDAAAIRALTRTAYAEWVPLIGREPRPMVADYDRAVRLHRIDLLIRGDEIAGLIELIPSSESILIENVAVAPAYRGQGLARVLMEHAEAVAVALGRPRLTLYTNKLFARNVQIYEHLGYRVDREEAWTGGVIVHMSKLLPTAPAAG